MSVLSFKITCVFNNLKCIEDQKISLRGRSLLVIYHNAQVDNVALVLESPKSSRSGTKSMR